MSYWNRVIIFGKAGSVVCYQTFQENKMFPRYFCWVGSVGLDRNPRISHSHFILFHNTFYPLSLSLSRTRDHTLVTHTRWTAIRPLHKFLRARHSSHFVIPELRAYVTHAHTQTTFAWAWLRPVLYTHFITGCDLIQTRVAGPIVANICISFTHILSLEYKAKSSSFRYTWNRRHRPRFGELSLPFPFELISSYSPQSWKRQHKLVR